MLKVLTSVAVLAYSAYAADPADKTVGGIKVQFTGNSGGFKLIDESDPESTKRFIKISQDKFEECGADGKSVSKGFKFTPTNGNWETMQEGDLTTTTYTKSVSSGGSTQSLKMITYLTSTTKEVNDTATGMMTTLRENTLKFSIKATGFEFQDSANYVCYGIDIKSKASDGSKDAEKAAEKSEDGGKKKKFSTGGASIEAPVEAYVDDVKVTEGITIEQELNGKKMSLNFRFPSFQNSLAYDPDLGFDGANPATRAMSSIMVLALCVFAFLV